MFNESRSKLFPADIAVTITFSSGVMLARSLVASISDAPLPCATVVAEIKNSAGCLGVTRLSSACSIVQATSGPRLSGSPAGAAAV